MMNKEENKNKRLKEDIKVLEHCLEFYKKFCEEDGLQPIITGQEAKSLTNLLKYIDDLQQKLDKILTYAKDRCDDYLKEDDCEYCDGVFASCRKVLQLAGEDISEYK